jgi:hypothetical protein
MRTTVSTLSAVALLAAGAGSAAARPADMPLHRSAPSRQAAAPRTPPTYRYDLADNRPPVALPAEPATPATVRVIRAAGGSFDWADAGIGAALTAALLLSAAGVSTLRRQHTPTTR